MFPETAKHDAEKEQGPLLRQYSREVGIAYQLVQSPFAASMIEGLHPAACYGAQAHQARLVPETAHVLAPTCSENPTRVFRMAIHVRCTHAAGEPPQRLSRGRRHRETCPLQGPAVPVADPLQRSTASYLHAWPHRGRHKLALRSRRPSILLLELGCGSPALRRGCCGGPRARTLRNSLHQLFRTALLARTPPARLTRL